MELAMRLKRKLFMKNFFKKILSAFLLVFLLSIPSISFAEEIKSIDINVDIDKDGIGHVSETWSTEEDNHDATEKYKVISDLGEIEIKDFKVKAFGKNFTNKDPWDVDKSFEEKAYKSGMIKDGDRVELCWGISDFGDNTYELSYNISPLVVGLNDYDMVYFRFVKENLDPKPNKVSVKINGYEPFGEDVSMWGMGFEGEIHNVDGSIVAQSNGNVDYALVMLRFPKGTFNTSYKIDKDFDYYAKLAQEGSDYEKESDTGDKVGIIALSAIAIMGFAAIITAAIGLSASDEYRIKDTEVLKSPRKLKEEYYRDIPYDGPIEDTFLIGHNAYESKVGLENYLNAFLLKWLYEDAISYGKEEDQVLFIKTDKPYITIKQEPKDMSKLERGFFEILKGASNYGGGQSIYQKDIEEYLKENEEKTTKYFESFEDNSIDNLSKRGYLRKYKEKRKFSLGKEKYNKYIDFTDDGINLYENFIRFKNYLSDYSLLSGRDVNEVKLWDYYMIYAAIYGISEEVYKNFTDVYPEYEQMGVYNYHVISGLNSYSKNVGHAVSNSLPNFEAAGGGGFTSSAGGAGSFGGGSGGAGGGSR